MWLSAAGLETLVFVTFFFFFLKKIQIFRELEAVIGSSVCSSASTASCVTGSLAFVCGNVVKRLDGEKESLLELPKSVSAVCFSQTGMLAVGEKGAKPRVLVFNNQRETVFEYAGAHQFGVASLAFSPSGAFLASSGFLNDGFLRIYSVQGEKPGALAVSKIGSKVFGLVWEGTDMCTHEY